MLARLAIGEDGDPVRPLWPPPSIVRNFAFEDEVGMLTPIHEALGVLSAQIAGELAARRVFCRSLSLRVLQSDGARIEDCERLVFPASNACALHRAALRIFGRLPLSQEVLSLQLRACDLGAGSGLQLSLLDGGKASDRYPHERRLRLETTISRLRKRYGPAAVFTGDRLPGRGRVGFWTYPIGHLLAEPVKVWTNPWGLPVRYLRSKKRFAGVYDVKGLQDRWKTREWVWGAQLETAVFRVLAEPGGLQELQQIGVRWTLGAAFD